MQERSVARLWEVARFNQLQDAHFYFLAKPIKTHMCVQLEDQELELQ